MTKEQVYVKNRFARSQLVDEFELPEGNEVVDVLSDEICGESRWTVTYDLIFRLPGQPEDEAWSTTYERGKTEAQEMPIWDGENEIECLLVRRKRVETYEWQPVLQQTLAESKKDE